MEFYFYLLYLFHSCMILIQFDDTNIHHVHVAIPQATQIDAFVSTRAEHSIRWNIENALGDGLHEIGDLNLGQVWRFPWLDELLDDVNEETAKLTITMDRSGNGDNRLPVFSEWVFEIDEGFLQQSVFQAFESKAEMGKIDWIGRFEMTLINSLLDIPLDVQEKSKLTKIQ